MKAMENEAPSQALIHLAEQAAENGLNARSAAHRYAAEIASIPRSWEGAPVVVVQAFLDGMTFAGIVKGRPAE